MTPRAWLKQATRTAINKALNFLATASLLAFAYVLVLFGLLATLNIVAPSLVADQAFVLFFSVLCGGIVIAPPVLLERLRTLPNDSLQTTDTENSVAPMIRNLRLRSRLFKFGAAAAFVLVVGTTILGFTVLSGVESTTGTIGPKGATAGLVLLFLLQTLTSIYRYNMRLAAFYDSKADYLQAGGKTKDLNERDLMNLFSHSRSQHRLGGEGQRRHQAGAAELSQLNHPRGRSGGRAPRRRQRCRAARACQHPVGEVFPKSPVRSRSQPTQIEPLPPAVAGRGRGAPRGAGGGFAALLRHRDREGDARILADASALGPDAPAMGLDQTLADGESQAARPTCPVPGARVLEEQPAQAFRRDAPAVVGDRDRDVNAVAFGLDADRQGVHRVAARLSVGSRAEKNPAPPSTRRSSRASP